MVHQALQKCNISERPGELKSSSHFPPQRILWRILIPDPLQGGRVTGLSVDTLKESAEGHIIHLKPAILFDEVTHLYQAMLQVLISASCPTEQSFPPQSVPLFFLK